LTAERHNTTVTAAFARLSDGYIRLGNKRAGAAGKPKPGEIAFDIDRKNRVLGNPFILRDPNDKVARADVIERFRAKYHADLACDGPMAAATQALAERVKTGERIVCMCWCCPSHATELSSLTKSSDGSNESRQFGLSFVKSASRHISTVLPSAVRTITG
jgi:Domain of unknown function (DUF4326)